MSNSKISNTGFWSGDNAHNHHVHSPKLAEWISRGFFGFGDISKYTRIYDLGCGLGEYLKKLKEDGFSNLVGFEGDIPQQAVFDNIWKQDLTQSFGENIQKGHVIMLEVGEHIPKEFEQTLIENVSRICRGYLVLSWAVPGQAGFGHVNCKTNEEVIEMFKEKGFLFLEGLTREARQNVDDNAPWFRNTLMIFYK